MDAIKEGMLASAKAAEAAARIGERLFFQNTQSVMNFKSQVCTDKIQSERLLSLGLKKETADMLILSYSTEQDIIALPWSKSGGWTRDNSIPAWSFARLLEIFLTTGGYRNILFVSKGDHMAYLVEQIRRYILEGFLDKRFLED